MSCMREEHGITDILITAIALPLIALIGAAALDYIRIPLTRNLAHDTLRQMLSLSIPYANCKLSDGTAPKAQLSIGGGSKSGGVQNYGTCEAWSTLDAFQPAAHNFCFLVEGDKTFKPNFGAGFDGGCEPQTTKPSFLTRAQAQSLSKVYANRIYDAIVNSASSWPYDIKANDIYVEVSYARTMYNNQGVYQSTACPLGNDQTIGIKGNDGLLDLGSSQSILQLSSGSSNVCSHFSQFALNQLGWKVERCSGGANVGECSQLWLPSYWMVAVINVRLNSYLGGLAWPASANGEAYYIVKDWVVLPHLNLAGVEKTSVGF